MFYKGGEVISDQFVHFIIIQRYSPIIAMIWFQNKRRYFLGSFPKRGGGVPYSQNVMIFYRSRLNSPTSFYFFLMLPNIWSRQHSLHCLNKSWNNQSSLNRNLLILWKLTSKSYLFSMPSFRHCTFPTQLASKGIGRRCTCFVSGTYSWYFQKIANMDFSLKYLKTLHVFWQFVCCKFCNASLGRSGSGYWYRERAGRDIVLLLVWFGERFDCS